MGWEEFVRKADCPYALFGFLPVKCSHPKVQETVPGDKICMDSICPIKHLLERDLKNENH